MGSLGDFLRGLLVEGRVILQGRPVPSEGDRPEALEVLKSAFDDTRLDLAGPPIAFDPKAALECSELVRQACWFLVSRAEPVEEMERSLVLPRAARTDSEHLSADLSLKFLPPIHRRARAIAPGDRLEAILTEVARTWPLSGVLSDVDEAPMDVDGLGVHPGLWMLYAERLARNLKVEWLPRGVGSESVDLVFDGLSLTRPIRLVEREGVALGG